MSSDRPRGRPPKRLMQAKGDAFPPLSATTRAEFAVRTRRAASHAVSDDHYLVTRLGRNQETLFTSLPDDEIPNRFEEFAYAMVVADGMGAAGETASRLALTALVDLALRFGEWRLRVETRVAQDIAERISTFYRQIDYAFVHANRSEEGAPLHTALTAAVSGGRDLFIAHVGHSRAYLLRDHHLLQLTRDHTRATGPEPKWAHLVDLTGIASDVHHQVTDALGAGTAEPRIEIGRLTLADKDLVLLCSNGLTDVLGDQEITEILLRPDSIQELCSALVARAAALDAADDVTAVLGRYHVPG